MPDKRYQWAAFGDINSFFGLVLDNVAGLILALGLLQTVFQFPVDFAIRYMVPGTALGVLAGDLMYFVLAFVLARRSGSTTVTAMPLGLDTPSTIGMVLFVIGPAYKAALETSPDTHAAAISAWHIGICALLITGLVKLFFSFFSSWAHRYIPRAGLLGSLAAIALVIIAFNQVPKLLDNPVAGFTSLIVVLIALTARIQLPFRIPGALAAVGLGCLVWHLMRAADWGFGSQLLPVTTPAEEKAIVWFPQEWLTVFGFEWLDSLRASLAYLPYVIPFAITTVIGGIDCAESAAAAGDKYSTSGIIAVEAVATLIAAVCGGVIQTTPYIGHPAYKAMGGRAAYTLATAIFVGAAGVIGYFELMFKFIPEAAILPILIFIGLEITAQSFQATPRRHYAALALACMPALAKLVMIFLGQFLVLINPEALASSRLAGVLLGLSVLSAGFIITSLLWSSALAEIIDRRFGRATVYLLVAAVLTACGVIHSPLVGEKMFWPWEVFGWESAAQFRVVIEMTVCYLLMAGIVFLVGRWVADDHPVIESDEEFEELE
jgi:adenine/guanine/hypoxanthine permease